MKARKIFDELFASRNINSSPVDVDGLDDSIYDYTILVTYESTNNNDDLVIFFNGDTTTSNYQQAYMRGQGGSPGASNDTTPTGPWGHQFFRQSVTEAGLAILKLTGETIDNRVINGQYCSNSRAYAADGWWDNVIDNITDISFRTSSVATITNLRIIIWETPKTHSLDVWEKVETKTWTSQDILNSPITFSDLVGDTDLEYRIDWEQDSASNNRPLIEANSDSTNHYTNQNLRNSTGSIGSSNQNSQGFETLANNESVATQASIFIFAKTGQERLAMAEATCRSGGRTQNRVMNWWPNTVDEITDLDIVGSSTALSTGEATLYRKKKPEQEADRFGLPFKVIARELVSGDYSGGTNFGGLSGDDYVLLKITWIGDSNGNNSSIRYQFNSDTANNYDDQVLIAGGGSASASLATRDHIRLTQLETTGEYRGEAYIYTKAGQVRPVLEFKAANQNDIRYGGAWWDNTVDEIDEVDVYGSSSNSIDGEVAVSVLVA